MSSPRKLKVQAGGIVCEHRLSTIREVTKISVEDGDDLPVSGDDGPTDEDVTESEHHDKLDHTMGGDLDGTESGMGLDFTEFGDNYTNSSFKIGKNEDYFKGNRFLAMKRQRQKAGKTPYVVKMLRETLEGEEQLKGIEVMAWEVKFLSESTHPNIAKLRGTSGQSGHADFMIVTDRAYLSLDDKFPKWRIEHQQRTHSQRSLRSMRSIRNLSSLSKRSLFGLGKRNSACIDLMIERLSVCHDIASVIKYLHKKKIIYRDLKPKNVGFDYRGNVRILDFSLCREVSEKDLVSPPHDYNCTGLIGSRRWMAPEVYLCKPYGFASDAFSFGLLFWSIFSLKTPFDGLGINKHCREVIHNGKRPGNLRILPKRLRKMMLNCWKVKPGKRPPFKSICSTIHGELLHLEGKDQSHSMPNMNVRTGTSQKSVTLQG